MMKKKKNFECERRISNCCLEISSPGVNRQVKESCRIIIVKKTLNNT